MVLEKTLESPLDYKEIQPVHSEEDQPWDFFGRNDAKAEAPVLWPPHAKSWLIGKDSDAGRDWGQEEKGMTEDEMAVLDGIMDSMDVSLSNLQGLVMEGEAWRAAVHGVVKSWTWLSNWTELSFLVNVFSTPFNKNVGVLLLDCVVRLWLAMKEIVKFSPKMEVPFCISTNREWDDYDILVSI